MGGALPPPTPLQAFAPLAQTPLVTQEEGQEDQGEVGGGPLAVLSSPSPPGLPSGFALGSLELPPGRYFQGDGSNSLIEAS